MILAAIDFEATGVDPKKALIIEVGAILTNEDFTGRTEPFSTLVHQPQALPLSDEVKKITGISDTILMDNGMLLAEVIGGLARFTAKADYFIAHNKNYDQVLLNEECLRNGFEKDPDVAKMLAKPWFCTLSELERPKSFKCGKLSHLALDYGVTVNPNSLHRASDDVNLMLDMLKATGKTFDAMLDFVNEPWVYLQAKGLKKPWEDEGKSVANAKIMGYSWQQIPGVSQVFEKQWIKRVKLKDFNLQDEQKFFKVQKIGGLYDQS